jgi:hypothetical protein
MRMPCHCDVLLPCGWASELPRTSLPFASSFRGLFGEFRLNQKSPRRSVGAIGIPIIFPINFYALANSLLAGKRRSLKLETAVQKTAVQVLRAHCGPRLARRLLERAAGHQQPEFIGCGFVRRNGRHQPSFEHHSDAVA